MVESWIDLEKRITSRSPKKLRADLLNDIRFILENYGTPRIYYERTNNMTNKINDKILEFHNIRFIAFGQEDQTLMKGLYQECAGKKEFDTEDYRAFYVSFCKNTALPFYGDTIGEIPGRFGPYSCTRLDLMQLMRLLETGKAPNTDGKFDEYNKEVVAASNGPESDMHYR